MNKEKVLQELEKLASKNEGVRVLEDYHRGILDAIEIVKKLNNEISDLEIPLSNRCEKCGGYMQQIGRNQHMCIECYNTWNNI